mmetsp:Transcript_103516/g.194799  ORF Transcript_103516/g.194799 Transcript_103516/m.194799 type:complete len:402 (+) Transcript_103516:272-1477(+)
MCQSQFAYVDLYDVLGIPASAQSSEVSSAYRRAARRTHPDKGGSAEAFQLTAFAFEVLSCPITRSLYDKQQICSKEPKFEAPIDRCVYPEHVSLKRGSCNSPVAADVTYWQVSLHDAMANLRNVLQAMEVQTRRFTISRLAPQVRSALLAFMEKQPKTLASKRTLRMSRACVFPLNRSRKRESICMIRKKEKYQARIRIKDMRLYTLEQFDLDTAVEHQILLARLRCVMADETAIKPGSFLQPEQLIQKCLEVLSQHGVTEESLGLRVFLEFRASPWCGPRCTISSPTYKSLEEALKLNARLLQARSASWETLRLEWIRLLMIARRGQPKQLTIREAEAITDAARRDGLQRQMEQAAHHVERALGRRAQKLMQARQTEKKRLMRARKLFWKERRKQDRMRE